jgi:KAP family P-loop domain
MQHSPFIGIGAFRMDGDRPIENAENDRLGFATVAKHLAHAIADEPAPDGFVFGIEGKWGSGKSTLINLTIEALRKVGSQAPEIISFSPWLVGDRDILLFSLFDELATAAVKIDPITVSDAGQQKATWSGVFQRNAHSKLKQKERLKLGDRLKAFGALAGAAGSIAKVASLFGVPYAEFTGKFLERGAQSAKQFADPKSLSKRKKEIVSALRLLSRPIVVFIDDLDRLEPREASEVLRLIRAVADFPNIIYVLSYDPAVMAQTLSRAVQVDDGAAFLEKIIQVSFRVPRPEAYDLRRWFSDEVEKMFANELSVSQSDPDSVQRLARVIDVEGGRYLNTPRDIVRVLNALRLHGLPVRTLIDIPDMVWLQLIRIGNPDLYSWVEKYLVDVSAITNGASVPSEDCRFMAGRFEGVLREEGLDVVRATIDLQEILPGLATPTATQSEIRVYQDLTNATLDPFVVARRLGSPQHYRYYYAFSQPSGALPDVEVARFVETATQSADGAIRLLRSLSSQTRPQGGNAAEVLIDRLAAMAQELPTKSIGGILIALAETLDDPAFSLNVGDFGVRMSWQEGSRALGLLLPRLSGQEREVILRQMFRHCKAIGWLTQILRNEIFAHGRFGDRAIPPDRWLLTSEEFDKTLSIMLQRYREAVPLELLKVPNFLSLLYAWMQGSGTNEARDWVSRLTEADEGLLDFLSVARGRAVSSHRGIYYPLKRRDLEPLMDVENVLQRLDAIAANPGATSDNRKRAGELRTAFVNGEDF